MSGDTLNRVLGRHEALAIAVSGGVDSLTLAIAAHRFRNGRDVVLYHAISPAVPREASERVKRHAQREGMALHLIDAGEFADPDYRKNPLDRCFFCKMNLYGTVARAVGPRFPVASGTNTDDLGDFRPGLAAAERHKVLHPYVDAGMDKAAVRRLASELGLGDVAALPASPCLSSRVETGIRIEPATLRMIDEVESALRRKIDTPSIRCRVRAGAVVIEIGETPQDELDTLQMTFSSAIGAIVARHRVDLPVKFERYRRGSAFLHG